MKIRAVEFVKISYTNQLQTIQKRIQELKLFLICFSPRGESCTVDNKWFNFIAENLLAYSVVIHEIIPRFERIDLTSPKHAHMLYRLSKVLSQPNLAHLLKEVEGCLEDGNTTHNDSSYLSATGKSNTSSYLLHSTSASNSLSLSHRLNAIIRQEMQELEPPNFQYKPLFNREFRVKVLEFIMVLQQSLLMVKNLLNSALSEQAEQKSSFLQMVKSFFLYSSSGDDYTVDERQKTVSYLELSISLLSEAFGVTPPLLPDTRTNLDNSGSSASLNSSGQSHYGSVEPTLLNPRDWQKRTKLIKYEANPDLEPIRSTEVTFLVRFFHQVSLRINEMVRLRKMQSKLSTRSKKKKKI